MQHGPQEKELGLANHTITFVMLKNSVCEHPMYVSNAWVGDTGCLCVLGREVILLVDFFPKHTLPIGVGYVA